MSFTKHHLCNKCNLFYIIIIIIIIIQKAIYLSKWWVHIFKISRGIITHQICHQNFVITLRNKKSLIWSAWIQYMFLFTFFLYMCIWLGLRAFECHSLHETNRARALVDSKLYWWSSFAYKVVQCIIFFSSHSSTLSSGFSISSLPPLLTHLI